MNVPFSTVTNPAKTRAPGLKWTFFLLVTGKYFSAVLGGVMLAIAIALREQDYALACLGFTSYASILALVQSGLLGERPWARKAAIVISVLRIPSPMIPVAILSLRDLLSSDVASTYARSTGPARAPIAWRLHGTAAIAYFAMFSLLATSSMIYGNGLGTRSLAKPPGRHKHARAERPRFTLPATTATETEH